MIHKQHDEDWKHTQLAVEVLYDHTREFNRKISGNQSTGNHGGDNEPQWESKQEGQKTMLVNVAMEESSQSMSQIQH